MYLVLFNKIVSRGQKGMTLFGDGLVSLYL